MPQFQEPLRHRAVPSLAVACLLTLPLLAGGCQSKVYQAGKLPAEFLASHAANPSKVDLSRLGRTAARTEVIYSGDVVEVTIATGLEDKSPESWPLRIADNGEVNVPLVGPIRVVGLLLQT